LILARPQATDPPLPHPGLPLRRHASGRLCMPYRKEPRLPHHHDPFDQLTSLAPKMGGAILHALTREPDQVTAVMDLPDGRTRLSRTFADGEGYHLPAYTPMEDDATAGAVIVEAFWDDSWRIDARLGDQDLHIRMFGRLISVVGSTGSG
jgi:hypothetical protein